MQTPGGLRNLLRDVVGGQTVSWDAVATDTASEVLYELAQELRIVSEIGRVKATLAQLGEAATDPEALPSSWGSLRVTDHVGRGSFGDVYRAWDPHLEREVALKVLRRIEPDAVPSAVVAEGRDLARVRHPNVVTVFGANRIRGHVGIWMEFVRGCTLEDTLRASGPLDAATASRVGVEVCRALAAVHAAGLVHRDVKARNVMCDATGRIVLMDFGTGETVPRESGCAAGTPLYVAPEVLQGEPATARSDLYSLGVLLFYMVTGAYPVDGTSLGAIREAHREGTGRQVTDYRQDLPRPFIVILHKALAGDPACRFENALDMERALTAALPHRPVRSRLSVWQAGAAATALLTAACAVWQWQRQAPVRPRPLRRLRRGRQAGYGGLYTPPIEARLRVHTRVAPGPCRPHLRRGL